MEITVAKSAGFCFGVQRAVDSVYKELEENSGKIYTFGPIIHNEQVVEDLNKKGIEVIDTVEQLKKIKEGTVVIRSHGVAKEIYDILEQQKLKMVDATCPFVKKIHNIVLDESNNGKTIIIIGNDNHPEVEGIKGWVNGEVIVINKEEQIEKLSLPEQTKACIVSQTTFNHNKFKYLVEIIRKKGYDITVVNTICNATHVRQVEAQYEAYKSGKAKEDFLADVKKRREEKANATTPVEAENKTKVLTVDVNGQPYRVTVAYGAVDPATLTAASGAGGRNRGQVLR